MKKTIITYGASVLRQKAEKISANDKYQELIANLFDSLNTDEGIGLAAPQLSVAKRVFVTALPQPVDGEGPKTFVRKAWINPEIITISSIKNTYREGCLSIPGIFEEVLRPESLVVRYYNEDLQPVEEEISDLEARVFQHEFDHLEGILFTDKINPLKRKLLGGKLRKIKNNT